MSRSVSKRVMCTVRLSTSEGTSSRFTRTGVLRSNCLHIVTGSAFGGEFGNSRKALVGLALGISSCVGVNSRGVLFGGVHLIRAGTARCIASGLISALAVVGPVPNSFVSNSTAKSNVIAVTSIMTAIGCILKGTPTEFGFGTTSIGGSNTVAVNSIITVMRVMLASNTSTMSAHAVNTASASCLAVSNSRSSMGITLGGAVQCDTFRVSIIIPRGARVTSMSLDTHTDHGRSIT